MHSTADRRPGSVLGRVMWGVGAVITGAVVVLVTNVTQGVCYDSGTDPAASVCMSGPVIGVTGVWVIWILWTCFAGLCAYRIMRRPPR
jgi:hypothetical protein